MTESHPPPRTSVPTKLVLASASPRRRELLGRLCETFTVDASDVPEIPDPRHSPVEICLENARAKARVVSLRHPDALILGADTEVCLDQRVFGKPADLSEAASFLRQLAGRTHEVITGLCFCLPATEFERQFSDTTLVTFHPLSDDQIQNYLREIRPLDKAGAYAVQECGDWIIESIHGSLSNVIGLPLGRLRREFQLLPAEFRPHLRPVG